MKNLSVVVLLLFAVVICRAENIVRGPYLQLLTPNSVVIRWRTDKPSSSKVEFWPDQGQFRDKATANGKTAEHIVSIGRLSASTKYFYTIGVNDGKTFIQNTNHFFITAPPIGTPQPIRFWVL